MPRRMRVIAIVFSLTFVLVGASCLANRSQKQQTRTKLASSFKRMPDGLRWTTVNLNVNSAESYCYEDAEQQCRQYGRLYTWRSAQLACQSLGDGWRLPTDAEWRRLAKRHGGISIDSSEGGKAAYSSLLLGGNSGFNAVLGGNRSENGEYARLEAHGFYWTATEDGTATAVFYNFGRGGRALHRQSEGNKQMALSVRCVK